MSKLNANIFLGFILLLSFICFFACNKKNENITNINPVLENGLCVYPTNIIDHPEFQYQEIDVNKVSITGDAIILYKDIISYDTISHIITLSFPVDSLKIKKDVNGTPVLITLDGEKIYGLWFWTAVSSAICNWVVVVPDSPFDSLMQNQFKIDLGYPTSKYFKGNDPRNNSKIISRLVADGKAI